MKILLKKRFVDFMNNAQDPLEKPPQSHNVLLKKKKKKG